MMSLLLFRRGKDNNQGLAPGADLINVCMIFLRLQNNDKNLTDLHVPHKRVNVEVEKLLYDRWDFCHSIMHSTAMILNL